DWMDDCDIFGVQCPETEEIYYCSIMGAAGTHFGIVAYRGTPGLEVLLKIMHSNGKKFSPDVLYEQNCLQCSFENREMLDKEDLQVIKSLGLKFRGRNQWPQFRDHSPGLYPWFINSSQCRTLTHILRQALEVSLRCRESKQRLYAKKDEFLVRVMQKDNGGAAKWTDSYLSPAPCNLAYTVFRLQDEVLVHRLKNIKSNAKYKAEAGIFYLPVPVRDEGRPYFPRMCILLNKETGAILAAETIRNTETEGHMFLSAVIRLILESGRKPAVIYVSNPEANALFSGLCNQVGINLQIAERSRMMEEFYAGLVKRYQKR
ncbi:MAG: hypothetical protein N2491_08195, partial [Negativicutes bacterium]|nr:hypothetical protein [Negativicutes bacterium]